MIRTLPALAALLLAACSSLPSVAPAPGGGYTVTTFDADGRVLNSWTVPKIERHPDGRISFGTPEGTVTASGSYLVTRVR